METRTPHRRYLSLNESQIGFEIGPNVNFVVENSLCHGCGTCEAACPVDALEMIYEAARGIYLPVINDDKCDSCQLCVQTCPGFELDLNDKPDSQQELTDHPLVGSYDAIYRSYTNDAEKRERASSGGLITELCEHLISTGRVNGAIVTRMCEENALKAEAYVARTSEELISSQKSKYCPVPLNQILKQWVHHASDEKFVFVGLPHHVHGLRLLQRVFPHMQKRIPYVISSFTAHVPSQRATEFILYKNGIKPEELKKIEYRGGGNPGRMKLVTVDGREVFVPHLHWTYSGHAFPLFFYPVREWLYFDKMSEWADIVMGDNWMKGLEEQKGASTVIVRSKPLHLILQELIDSKSIVATKMTADDLVADQVLRTKLNIYWRLKIWKWLGRKIPLYTRQFEVLKGQKIKTARFAACVRLSEYPVPFWIMDKIIQADYFLRARPKMILRKMFHAVRRSLGMLVPSKAPIPGRGSRYKAVLIGGYGHFDIGDEAMPHAVRNNLRERMGNDIEIMMLSPFPENTREMHGEKSNYDFTRISHGRDAGVLRKCMTFAMTTFLFSAVVMEKFLGLRLTLWHSARAALDEIQSADLVLNVGGGNINSVIPSELYKKTSTYIIASILGKPVFLSGQTMGPYYGWFDKRYARFALNRVKMISFRDKDVSHARLLDIGVKNPIMFDAADDAISLEGIDQQKASLLLENETGLSMEALRKNLFIVMNMKASLSIFNDKGSSSDLEPEISLMARLADFLIEKYACTIVLLPTDFTDSVDDRVPHRRIWELAQNKDSILQVNAEYVDDELIGMIGLADVAIGARYHFNVFAASRHIPFAGIASGVYQRTKLEGLAKLCALDECYIDHDLGNCNFDEVASSVLEVINNRKELAIKLKQRVPQLKKQSIRVVDEVVNLLQSG